MNKNIWFVVVVTALLLMVSACGGSGKDSSEGKSAEEDGQGGEEGSTDGETITIEVGHIAPPDEAYSIGFEEYAKAVEKETDGRVQFAIYGNGQLGGERDLTEQVQMGSLDMSLVTTSVLTNFHKDLTVFEFPFLFKNEEEAYRVLDSEIGQEVLSDMSETGLHGIAFWQNGMRHLTNNQHQIYSPEDMNGLKMRTIESDIMLDTYSSLGADSTPMAFPEVYSSLQQGVVDGTDVPFGIFWSTNIYEVQDYISEAGLYYASAVLLMNQDFYNSLPEDIQKVMTELGKEYANVQREISNDQEAEFKEKVIEAGVDVAEADELEMDAFRKAVQPVYDQFGGQYGDYLERIQKMLAEE